jgi:methylenetetrahydrofolate reductase (NADPH)
VPGACIPNSIITRLAESKNPTNEGIQIAAEQVKSYLGITKGVHVMAIKAEERITEILNQAGINSVQQ